MGARMSAASSKPVSDKFQYLYQINILIKHANNETGVREDETFQLEEKLGSLESEVVARQLVHV